jgi:hypothetical protein
MAEKFLMPSLQRIRRPVGILAITVIAAAGCGGRQDALPREPISGTVSFNGAPLKSGTIQFAPDGTKEGIASGGLITDGGFQVARDDGPVPGKYRVLIFAEGAPQAAAKPEEGPVQEAKGDGKRAMGVGLIPMRYNLKTELTAEVAAGGPNSFTFDLKP